MGKQRRKDNRIKMIKGKLDDNSCNECNENCSTLKLKYSDTVYWLCDDCYVEHLKKSDLGVLKC
jgi:NAD-dependent SIR2 family protein deacetylase